jgi:ABC-2 type transport system ATP-binding protein
LPPRHQGSKFLLSNTFFKKTWCLSVLVASINLNIKLQMQLTITNLNKTYSNGVQALKDVSLTINQGMFGLLGPNGAGKSSLMRTIATLQEADSGSISLGDINVLTQKEDVRKTLGYLPQEFGVYPKIDAVTLLNHLAVLKGITNASERKNLVESLLQKTNLWESRKKNLGGFSGGMKQRFWHCPSPFGKPKTHHRGRTNGRTRPCGKKSFLEFTV